MCSDVQSRSTCGVKRSAGKQPPVLSLDSCSNLEVEAFCVASATVIFDSLHLVGSSWRPARTPRIAAREPSIEGVQVRRDLSYRRNGTSAALATATRSRFIGRPTFRSAPSSPANSAAYRSWSTRSAEVHGECETREHGKAQLRVARTPPSSAQRGNVISDRCSASTQKAPRDAWGVTCKERSSPCRSTA